MARKKGTLPEAPKYHGQDPLTKGKTYHAPEQTSSDSKSDSSASKKSSKSK